MHAAVRVFLFFSIGYFVSYLYRGLNIGFASHLASEMGLSAGDLGLLTSLYFLGFALTQIPAGAALDTWGPRRVNASLMLVAAVGSLIFGLSAGLSGLMVGRMLIGVGVAVCMGASFQALAQNCPAHRLPMLYGALVAIGGLGGVVIGTPLTVLLQYATWRELSYVMALVTAMVALLIWRGVTDVPMHRHGHRPSVVKQFNGTWEIFSSRVFWQFALFPAVVGGVFYAVQSLWVKPYLLDVNLLGLGPTDVLVSIFGLANVIGSVGSGFLARWFERMGINLYLFLGGCLVLYLLTQVLILVDAPIPKGVLWSAYGFFGATNILVYVVLAKHFPRNMLGRLNTSFTMLLFMLIFIFQNAIGWIVGFWEPLGAGIYPAAAHLFAWWSLLGLQVLSAIWYFSPQRSTSP